MADDAAAADAPLTRAEEDAAAEAMGMGARPEVDADAAPNPGPDEEAAPVEAAPPQEDSAAEQEPAAAAAGEGAASAGDEAGPKATEATEAEVDGADSQPPDAPSQTPPAGEASADNDEPVSAGGDGAAEADAEEAAKSSDLVPEQTAASAEEIAAEMGLEGSAEEEAAATKIQAIQRGKLERERLSAENTDGPQAEAEAEAEAEASAGAAEAQVDAARAEAKKNSVFAMLANSIGQKPGTPRNKYAERYNTAADSRIEGVKNPPPPQPIVAPLPAAAAAAVAEPTGAATGAAPRPVGMAAAASSSRAAAAAVAPGGSGDGLFKNLHLAELQTLLVTMGMPSDGGKYELLGRLQDTLEARSRTDEGGSSTTQQQGEPRGRDQLGREMPAWQQQQIEDGGQAYSGKGIFSAMAQDRVQARPIQPEPAVPRAVMPLSGPLGAVSQPPQRVEDRGDDAYAAAWRELEGGSGTNPPTYAQEGRHAAAAASSTAGGSAGFYGTAGSVLPSPPVGPRPEDQRTPRQLRGSTINSTLGGGGGGGGSGGNLQDRFAAADELVKQDQVLAENLDLLAELTGDYDGTARTAGSFARGGSQYGQEEPADGRGGGGAAGNTADLDGRDRRGGGGVAARGPEIDRGRKKTTRGHRNRSEDTPAMALRRKIRASSYNTGGEDWEDAFKQYDRDESGELDFEEFKRAMRRTAKIAPAVISDKELKKLFKLIDIDSGGSISASEFIAFLDGAFFEISTQHSRSARCSVLFCVPFVGVPSCPPSRAVRAEVRFLFHVHLLTICCCCARMQARVTSPRPTRCAGPQPRTARKRSTTKTVPKAGELTAGRTSTSDRGSETPIATCVMMSRSPRRVHAVGGEGARLTLSLRTREQMR